MSRYFAGSSVNWLRNLSTPISGTPFAIAGWFYEVDDQWNSLLSIGVDGSNNNRHTLNITDSGNGRTITMQSRTASNAAAETTSGYSTGQWNHAAGVVSANDERHAYLNGGSKGSDTTGRVPTGMDAVYIGGNMNLGSTSVGCRIARIGIWDLSGWPGASDYARAANWEANALPALAEGALPILFPLGLEGYWEVLGDFDPEPDWSGNSFSMTNGGAGGGGVQASHVSRPIFPPPIRFWSLPPAAGGVTHTGSATLNGVGDVVASAVRTLVSASSIAGSGTLASSGSRILVSASTLDGVGSITAIGQTGATLASGAFLNGVGAVTASGARILISASALDGVGTLTIQAVRILVSASALDGVSTITAVGQRLVNSAALLDGAGSLIAVGARTLVFGAALTGAGSLTSTGALIFISASTLNGVGTITGDPAVVFVSAITLPGVGTIVAVGTVVASDERLTRWPDRPKRSVQIPVHQLQL